MRLGSLDVDQGTHIPLWFGKSKGENRGVQRTQEGVNLSVSNRILRSVMTG